jgi:inositol phosphorylceramide mannosyltransferase catalytic subunit
MPNGSIPKLLHQTWKTENVPEVWREFALSWRKFHSSWDYRLWTDEANREFVAENYSSLLDVYDSYSYGIQRADVIRYCLLHHFGGVYADLDIECLEPIDKLVAEGEFIAVLEPAEQGAWLGKTSLFSNAFMASRPGHPFLSAVLEWLARDRVQGLTHRDVLATTGPLMLDEVFRAYSGNDVSIVPSHLVFPFVAGSPELAQLGGSGAASGDLRARLRSQGTIAIHYWANSWVDGLAGQLVNEEPYAVVGFDFYPGVDSPGNDIGNVGRDVQRAAAACRRMKEAVAFNTDGFVKDRVLPPHQWLPMKAGPGNVGLYVKKRKPAAGIVAHLVASARRLLASSGPSDSRH